MPPNLNTDGQDIPDEPSENHIVGENPINIDLQDNEIIRTVIFFPDGKELVSVGGRGKIRRWGVADGKEVGKAMDAGTAVGDAVISPDGKWIVAGTLDGQVMVWDAKDHEKTSFQFRHSYDRAVNAVDISADSESTSLRIASGSDDKTVIIWPLPDGTGNLQKLGPLLLDDFVTAVKFSPNGKRIAAATYYRESVQVYDSHNGQLLANFPVYVCTALNGSIAWKSNSEELFALSSSGDIHCLDVPTQTTHLRWNIDDDKDIANYIAKLSCDDRLIATSGNSTFSFWDVTTHQNLGVALHGFTSTAPMAISPNYDIAVASDKKIIIQRLPDLPSIPSEPGQPAENGDTTKRLEEQEVLIEALRKEVAQLKEDKGLLEQTMKSNEEHLEEVTQKLHESQAENERLQDEIGSLRAQNDPQNPSKESAVQTREMLYHASSRKITGEEDFKRLFGDFDIAPPVTYAGVDPVVRLLEHILTRPDNLTVLSWTGTSNTIHSYLPADLTVYNQIAPPHLPQEIDSTDMDTSVESLDPSLRDPFLTTSLYNRLQDLAPLSLVAGRLRLPGIVFPLADVEQDSDSKDVYRVMSPMLGNVEIKTTDSLIGMNGLRLIHPWITPLLEQDLSYGSQPDLTTRAERLVVRLRQDFGALLLARVSRAQYKRVATDCLITVCMLEETGLSELMAGIQTVNVQ